MENSEANLFQPEVGAVERFRKSRNIQRYFQRFAIIRNYRAGAVISLRRYGSDKAKTDQGDKAQATMRKQH